MKNTRIEIPKTNKATGPLVSIVRPIKVPDNTIGRHQLAEREIISLNW